MRKYFRSLADVLASPIVAAVNAGYYSPPNWRT